MGRMILDILVRSTSGAFPTQGERSRCALYPHWTRASRTKWHTLVRLRFEAPRNRRAGKSLALHAGGNACRYMELVLHDMYPPPSAEPLWRKAVN